MTLLVDISCPRCGQTRPVRKVRIGTYRCTDCGVEFSHSDVRPR